MASHGHYRHLHARAPEPVAEPATLVSVVYVTAAPTFDGPIGGYTTVGVAAPETPETSAPAVLAATASATKAPVVVPAASETSTAAKQTPASTAVAQSSTSLPSEIIAPSTTLASSAPLLAATSSLTFSATTSANTASAASSTSTSDASSSSGGMGGGAIAGIIIGVLLLVGAILSLVLVCIRKRKTADKQRLADSEKNDNSNPFADPVRRDDASIRSSPNAPRLSLRPVTQFIPNLMERRASRGNALTIGSAVPLSEKALPDVRPETSHSTNSVNPFGNHAETIDSPNANGPVLMTSPIVEHAAAATTPVTPNHVPQAVAPVVGAAVAGAALAPGLKRGASKRDNGPKPLDFTKSGPFMGPPSPAGTDFSVTSDSATTPTQSNTSAAIAAAGGPPTSAVHRVQLDFKPSMEDELELRAGQLIRMLHEYDDGWALCIRLDRSQQGVVPRTCLSTRPVKPRPQQNGPRVSPQGHPMTANMHQQGRPMSPAGIRPMTPNGQQGRPMTPTGQQGRPMTPTGQQGRPMTPNSQNRQRGPPANGPMNGQGRPRAPSNAQQQARRNSPPGPSRMNPVSPPENNSPGPLRTPSGNTPQRKPVPGQAM
ncbi:hypothetical protein M7I_0901 [Glarea lozoyensis 74030]|uniref:SH3 domain-containing protein n=1 Tax=Glarea lozoyensis (strain ATCC 74030 / MF5533) TaxID=1104152 RepID=H0EEM1_GLAL7|nr:hypothetical protein M7I_0901 [Glarea lozoyensis 74030]